MTTSIISPDALSGSYDVIIVGGGQAGITLASRLTEDSSIKVLVIEAGAANLNDPLILTPPMAPQLYMNDQYDWHFATDPQDALAGRQVMHFRGKGLGGSSAINLHAVVFPSKASLDGWEALGNPGWGHDAMKPYYKKFHTFHEPSDKIKTTLGLEHLDPTLHGTDGPIQVSFGNELSDFDVAWHETFRNLGYPTAADPITGNCHGSFTLPNAVHPQTKQRSYAVSGYLTPEVQARPNLHIITETTVERVVLEGTKAVGVRFIDAAGKQRTVSSTETVVSSGVFQTPQVLELSGIGNPTILKKYGITPLIDLPGVGENLQDHSNVGVSFETKGPTMDSFRDPAVLMKAMGEYQSSQSGPLAKSLYSGASMPSEPFTSESGAKEFAALLDGHTGGKSAFPAQKQQYDLIRAIITDPKKSSIEYLCAPVQMDPLQSGAVDGLSDEAKSKDYFTIFASLSHPFSRGSVHIKSTDPKAAPSIDPKYFEHPLDKELMAHHLKWMNNIVTQDPFASLLAEGGRRIPENIDLTDLNQTREAVKSGFTTYHPCGSCAMMPKELNGVVDSSLRVHGVRGLRVVDASIFPIAPRGNLQTNVYAVAEKAADLIKKDLEHRTDSIHA